MGFSFGKGSFGAAKKPQLVWWRWQARLRRQTPRGAARANSRGTLRGGLYRGSGRDFLFGDFRTLGAAPGPQGNWDSAGAWRAAEDGGPGGTPKTPKLADEGLPAGIRFAGFTPSLERPLLGP